MGGCAGLAGDGAVVVTKGFFKIAAHGNGDVSGGEESDGHAKEFVGVATSFGEGAKFVFQLGEDVFDDGVVDVGDHGIIDVPSDRALGAIDGGVGDARVVRVERETHLKECFGEEFVPEKGTFDTAIKGALHFEIESLDVGFVDDELTESGADIAHEVDVFTGEFNDNEFIHESVEVGTGNVGGDDGAALETRDGEEQKKGVVGESRGVCFVFGVKTLLGAAVGTVAAFEIAIAFFFDDVDDSEGAAFLVRGEVGGMDAGVDNFVNHLLEFLADAGAGEVAVFADAGTLGHLG